MAHAARRASRPSTAVFGVLFAIAATAGGTAWYAWQLPDSAVSAMARGHYERAFQFYADKAREGDPAATNSLGNLLYLGLGVDADRTQAAQLYFDAARQGHAPAQLNLGHLYKQGLGVERDAMRAFTWYRMAHRYGNLEAEYYLSQITVEYTLSPLQMSTAKNRWSDLDDIVAEGLP